MRYTRYNHNRRRGGGRNNGAYNFVATLVAIVIVAIVLGVLVGKILLKDGVPGFESGNAGNNGGTDTPIAVDKADEKEKAKDEEGKVESSKDFYYLQCGVYSTVEKADSAIQALPIGYSGFVVEDNGKFKVLVGIFSLDNVQQKSDELKGGSIDNIKVKILLDGEDVDTKLKAGIIDGYMKIINQLSVKDVKSVESNVFKNWLAESIKDIKTDDKDILALSENINKLPEEVTKNDVANISKGLYEIMKNYKK